MKIYNFSGLKLTLQTKRRAHSSGDEVKKRAKKEEGSADDEEEDDSSHSNHPGGVSSSQTSQPKIMGEKTDEMWYFFTKNRGIIIE